jgi:hypothetical protein
VSQVAQTGIAPPSINPDFGQKPFIARPYLATSRKAIQLLQQYRHNGEQGGIEMFELAATPQRTFKGLTLARRSRWHGDLTCG